MKTVRLILISAAVFMLSLSAMAPDGTPQEKYIARYAPMAVSEMYRSGVPASITLAQGLLESRYGQSALASDGNNHFGIKCHDWTGRKQYADDDEKGECFRVYDTPEESFRDHSDFLRYKPRYKSLFENETTDYKAWAYGLKAAGYATDPAYPSKLIKLIEDYDLSRFDRMSVRQAEQSGGATVTRKTSEKPSASKEPKARRVRKGTMVGSDLIDDTQTEIAESPLSMEEPRKVVSGPSETYHFSLSRQMYSLNGVPFIYAADGETLEYIASSNNLFVKELMKFNDMKPGQEIGMGDVIYLQQKKKQTAKGLDKYISDQGGESLWQISQKYGVRLKDLCKRNSLSQDYVLREGDTILLR